MENSEKAKGSTRRKLVFDLGTFEGFNFRSQSAIERVLSAQDVIDWDHDRQAEAEFWPSGDRPELATVFTGKSSVVESELLELDRLLADLGGDSVENFLKIRYAANLCGVALAALSAEAIEDHNLHLFLGCSFIDLRKEAAYELFELYYPEEYAVWEKSLCDGLIFDIDRFLDSPSFSVDEVIIGQQKALLVAPQ